MPLVLSKDELKRIEKWTDENKEDPEMARRREYVQYLDATSRAMTKSWPNSLENVNKRNEELRRARHEAAEQANTRFYKRYVKRKQEEQERLMFSARDTVFKNKDAPKLLLSAVIETVIQKERSAQLKFHEEQRRLEAEQKRRDDDEIIQRAKDWHALMALKRKRRFEANKQHQKAILDQANEVAERNRVEYEAELSLQKIDNIKANEEIDAIKKFEQDFATAEKNRIWSDMERSRQENEQRRKEQAAREDMDNRLVDVLLRSRARVEQKRKQTEKDLKEEKIRVLEKISQKLESGDAERDAKDQAILEKAIKEKEAIAEARKQADERKKQQFKADRIAVRQKFLRDEAQRIKDFNTMRQWEIMNRSSLGMKRSIKDFNTMRQWEIMNRFKNEELYDDFKEHLRQEKERKIQEYRADILKLWKEREDREARERAETRFFYGELAEKKLRAADNKLLTHAAALVQEAKANNRPPYAIHRAVDRYCKLYRLYPMPDLPSSMQEHYKRYRTRDGSRPDPGYREPDPPPPDLGPDAPDLPEELEAKGEASKRSESCKRDGLQKPGPSKPTEKPRPPASAAVDDYRRAGRANGMQRRPELQGDIQLPPINVVPCKTESCRCDLKQ